MKTKTFKEEIREEFEKSGTLYCCYCCQPKSGFRCCGENHFVSFGNLYPEDQDMLIQEQLDEYNKWSASQ